MLPTSMNKKSKPNIPEEWRMEDSETEPESDPDEDEDEESDGYVIDERDYTETLNTLYKELMPVETKEDNKNKEYIYKGELVLKTDLEEQLLDIENNGLHPTIYIYAYSVNTSGKYPFLQYFFNKKIADKEDKEDKEDELIIPQFIYTDALDVLSTSIMVLSTICSSYHKEESYNFKGYYQETKESLLLFFDCSDLKIEKINITKHTDLVLVLMDEIIHYEKMGDIKIDKSSVIFFREHNDFLYLTDMKNNNYEMPTVAYTGCLKNKSDFVLTFGVSPLNMPLEALMGKYYYFTDYNNAQMMKDSECLIRFAIFLNVTQVKLNWIDDCVDNSQITEHLLLTLNKKCKEYNSVKFQLRISDRDGIWAINNDSIYVGRVELDDGSYFENYPLWVLKNYEQQIPLSSTFKKG